VVSEQTFRYNGCTSAMITRSLGTTPSERHLAQLADHTFLNLWSYPNVFKDRGSELCDLLVVCGNHIIVFSCKEVAWPSLDDPSLAWRRWHRRAMAQSARQIQGAVRWLTRFPDRVYLDPRCTQRLPIKLPNQEARKTHGVLVAVGAAPACRDFFGGGIGTFVIDPTVHAEQHGDSPFTIGDLNPSSSFIHVVDEAMLDILMSELDTVTDFTAYLSKKEQFLRSGLSAGAIGEEDLLAYYVTRINSSGDHDFTMPDGSPIPAKTQLFITEGSYQSLLTRPEYLAKKAADEPSYVWDRLIETFTNNLLNGTNIILEGLPSEVAEIEEGVRHMALVPRLLRRAFGTGILDLLERSGSQQRAMRAFMPGQTDPNPATGFFFMTMPLPPARWTYEDYRLLRWEYLKVYALSFLDKYRSLERVVGIATEPLPDAGNSGGSSEDLLMMEQPDWTDELRESLAARQADLGVLRTDQHTEYLVHGEEYPRSN
jgi:hypothetical protein